MADFEYQYIGGPLDGRWSHGDERPECFDAPPPFGVGDAGRTSRYRRVGQPSPFHIVAEFVGYSDELDPEGDELDDDFGNDLPPLGSL